METTPLPPKVVCLCRKQSRTKAALFHPPTLTIHPTGYVTYVNRDAIYIVLTTTPPLSYSFTSSALLPRRLGEKHDYHGPTTTARAGRWPLHSCGAGLPISLLCPPLHPRTFGQLEPQCIRQPPSHIKACRTSTTEGRRWKGWSGGGIRSVHCASQAGEQASC